MRMFFLFFVSCILPCCLVQAEIDIMFLYAECVYTSDEYIKPDSCQVQVNDDDEEDETTLSTQLEIIKQFPTTAEARGTVDALGMDGQPQYLGLHIEMNFCDLAHAENSIAIPLLRAMTMDPDDCPPKPGLYGSDAYAITDTAGLPDTFPLGRYLLNFSLVNEEVMIMNYEIDFRVY